MDNIYKAVQLTIDSQNLALTKTPTHVYIANQYVDTNDTPLITAPFIIQKALENGTGVVDIVSSTIGSIYEVRLLCDAEVLISGYFYMPPMNVNFSELELYTSYPPRTPPVINEFWQKTENFILEKTNTLLNFVQVFNSLSSMRLSLGYLEELLTTKKSNLVSAINEVLNKTKEQFDIVEEDISGINELLGDVKENGWTDMVIEVSENVNQRQINDGLDSIAQLLSIKNPRDGMRAYVKSYHAGLNIGGGTFVYDATKSTVNDGALVFSGWVRQLDSDVFTPYMSGCKCDGITDDAQNLDKLNLALYRNKLQGRIIFDSDILINSELPRTENLAFVETTVKVGVRLVSGVHLEIKSGVTIKIGNYFTDSGTFVFCGANYQSLDDWSDIKHQDDVHIFGGGTIDSTGAGAMTTKHSTSRYLIMLGGLSNFKMYGITTVGGDYSNIVVTRPLAKGGRVYDCTFKDTLVTNSYSRDHTTVWSPAPDWKVYNNKFIETSPKAKLISCAFESHGNQQYFYNNHIEGYIVVLLQCAYLWDDKQPSKDDLYVYGNTAHTCFFMNFWFDGNRPFGHADIHNNKHYPLPYFTEQSLIDAGVPLTDTSFGCSNRAFSLVHGDQAKDFKQKVNSPQIFRNNDFVGNCVPELDEQFFNTWLYLGEGIHIVNNNIKAPTIATIKNRFDDVPITVRLKDIVIKGNNLDFGGVRANKLYLDIKCRTLNNSDIEINFDNSYPTDISRFIPSSVEVWDGDNSKGNTIKITHNGQSNIGLSVAGVADTLSAYPAFADNNKIVFDDKAGIAISPITAMPNFAQITESWVVKPMKKVEIVAYGIDSTGGFVLPSSLNKSADGTSYNHIGVATHSTMDNTSTSVIGVNLHIRAST